MLYLQWFHQRNIPCKIYAIIGKPKMNKGDSAKNSMITIMQQLYADMDAKHHSSC